MDEQPHPEDDEDGPPLVPGLSDEDGPPLVMERLRRFGWLATVLVPLLVITLAQTAVSRDWAIIVFIGGLVALTAWSQRD